MLCKNPPCGASIPAAAIPNKRVSAIEAFHSGIQATQNILSSRGCNTLQKLAIQRVLTGRRASKQTRFRRGSIPQRHSGHRQNRSSFKTNFRFNFLLGPPDKTRGIRTGKRKRPLGSLRRLLPMRFPAFDDFAHGYNRSEVPPPAGRKKSNPPRMSTDLVFQVTPHCLWAQTDAPPWAGRGCAQARSKTISTFKPPISIVIDSVPSSYR